MFRSEGVCISSDKDDFKISRKKMGVKASAHDILETTAKTQEPSRITKDVMGTFFLQLCWIVRLQRIIWVMPRVLLDHRLGKSAAKTTNS